MAPMDTFCFVTLNLRNPSMEIGQIIRIYVAHWVLTNACLSFWTTFPNFYKGQKKLNIRQNFRQHSELAAYYSKTGRNIKKSKTIRFIADYLTIFTPNLVGFGWTVTEKCLRKQGWGRLSLGRPVMLLAAYNTRTGESRWALPHISGLWSPYVIGQTIIFSSCSFFLSFFLFLA